MCPIVNMWFNLMQNINFSWFNFFATETLLHVVSRHFTVNWLFDSQIVTGFWSWRSGSQFKPHQTVTIRHISLNLLFCTSFWISRSRVLKKKWWRTFTVCIELRWCCSFQSFTNNIETVQLLWLLLHWGFNVMTSEGRWEQNTDNPDFTPW